MLNARRRKNDSGKNEREKKNRMRSVLTLFAFLRNSTVLLYYAGGHSILADGRVSARVRVARVRFLAQCARQRAVATAFLAAVVRH